MVKIKPPVVELTLPVLPDMELAATKTAEVVSKHMGLNDDQAAEIFYCWHRYLKKKRGLNIGYFISILRFINQ